MFDDLTMPLELVVKSEKKPRLRNLKAVDQVELFEQWIEKNEAALTEMESVALDICSRGGRVSARYLIERQRYEGRARINPVKFIDEYGDERSYAFSNNLAPLLARWLKSRHPNIPLVTRKSMFDEFEDYKFEFEAGEFDVEHEIG